MCCRCETIKCESEKLRETIERLGERFLSSKIDRVLSIVERIELHERASAAREFKIMALGQDILDQVNAQTTVIDSFIALVQGLVDNNTIPQATADSIKAAIASSKAKLEVAILAHTPQQP